MPDLRMIFGVDKPLIAMCHLRGLPGRPTLRRLWRDGPSRRVGRSRTRGAPGRRRRRGCCSAMRTTSPTRSAVGVEVAAAMAAVIGQLP